MNRSTLFSVLLVGLLAVQGGAYGLSQSGSGLLNEASVPAGSGSSVDAPGIGVGPFAAEDPEHGNDSDESGDSEDSVDSENTDTSATEEDESSSQKTTTEETDNAESDATTDDSSSEETDDVDTSGNSESTGTSTTEDGDAESNGDSSDGESSADGDADEESFQSVSTASGSSSTDGADAEDDSTTTDDETETDDSDDGSNADGNATSGDGDSDDGTESGADDGSSSDDSDSESETTSLPESADVGSASDDGAADEGAPSTTVEATSASSAGDAGAPPSAGTTGAQSSGTAGQTASEQAPSGQAPGGAPPAGAAAGSAQVPAGAGAQAPGGAGGQASGGVPSGGAASGTGQSQQAGGGPAASPDADFEVVESSIDAPVGGSGTLTVEIENQGEDAENAVVALQSQDSGLTFGQSASASQFVGDWDEGETRTIEVDATVAPGADQRSYPVQATVSYEDDDGNQAQSAPLSFGVTPGDEQEFTLDSVDSSLSAGSQGTISGTITNNGPETAEDAVLVFAGNASDVMPRQSEVVLGEIDSGESVSFEYPVTVTQGTPPGDRQVPFVVQYRNADGETAQSGTLNAQVTIDERADDFEVTNVESDLEPGERGTVEVTLENQREDLTDATINLQSLSASVLFGETANASQFVGDWDEGDTKTIEVQATAAQGTTEGEYPMQASVSATDGDNQPAQGGPLAFGVPVGASIDDFEVVSVNSTVPVGDSGTVQVTLNNTEENATRTTVSLQSLSGDLLLGQTANATQFIGDWDVGEQRTVEFEVTASNETEQRSYPFQTSVSYTDTTNQQAQAGPYTIGVTPLREQAFTLGNATGNLSVGDEGTVSGTIVNEGPQPIDNAVISLTVNNENINAQQEEVAIGSLEAGESTNFSFPIEVSDNAEAGTQQFSFVVEYDNQEGETRASETLDTQVEVTAQEDAFTVETQNATLTPGGTELVTLEVTNNRNSVVRNVEAQAFTDDPLSLADDQAFISELGPDETANITFEVSATGEARPSTYPLSLDFQYETPDGDTRLTDTYEVPIQIEEQSGGLLSSLGGGDDGGFPPWILILIVLLVAVGLGYLAYQRLNADSSDSGSGDAAEQTGSTEPAEN